MPGAGQDGPAALRHRLLNHRRLGIGPFGIQLDTDWQLLVSVT